MSLVEVLVYIVVLITLATAIVGILISLRTVFERASADRRIGLAATNALERLTRDIRDADEVNMLLSTLSATSSVLVLENSATTTTYHLSDGALVVEVEGENLGPLTPQNVEVIHFTAVRYAGADSDMVRIQLGLQAVGRYASTTKNFSTAAVLRGSYEE